MLQDIVSHARQTKSSATVKRMPSQTGIIK